MRNSTIICSKWNMDSIFGLKLTKYIRKEISEKSSIKTKNSFPKM
jgi:hypothetical protein